MVSMLVNACRFLQDLHTRLRTFPPCLIEMPEAYETDSASLFDTTKFESTTIRLTRTSDMVRDCIVYLRTWPDAW